jgi:hypothetical protein
MELLRVIQKEMYNYDDLDVWRNVIVSYTSGEQEEIIWTELFWLEWVSGVGTNCGFHCIVRNIWLVR